MWDGLDFKLEKPLKKEEEKKLTAELARTRSCFENAFSAVGLNKHLEPDGDYSIVGMMENTLFRCPQPPEAVSEAYKAFSEIRKELVTYNLRLALEQANRFVMAHPQFEPSDALSAAVMGLIRAANDYDPERGTKFSTYAFYWVKRYLQEYASTCTLVPMPRRRQATIQFPDGEIENLEGTVNDASQEVLTAYELSRVLKAFEDVLDPREKEVVRLRYGINGSQQYSLKEIGKRFDLNHETIRQIQIKAIEKLRTALGVGLSNQNPPAESQIKGKTRLSSKWWI